MSFQTEGNWVPQVGSRIGPLVAVLLLLVGVACTEPGLTSPRERGSAPFLETSGLDLYPETGMKGYPRPPSPASLDSIVIHSNMSGRKHAVVAGTPDPATRRKDFPPIVASLDNIESQRRNLEKMAAGWSGGIERYSLLLQIAAAFEASTGPVFRERIAELPVTNRVPPQIENHDHPQIPRDYFVYGTLKLSLHTGPSGSRTGKASTWILHSECSGCMKNTA